MKFSTDVDPQKCKTKCIAFLKKPVVQLPSIKLCGNSLPWVDQIKHLGHVIQNKPCFTDQDVIVKRAQYINKNLELNQEFSFASSRSKFRICSIYNSHFYGSPIWDLFGNAVNSFLKSYNRSVRVIFNLPLTTHRNLLEPITQSCHLLPLLVSRFLGFLEKIRESSKIVPKALLNLIMRDVRSTTGSNLRNILLCTEKDDISQLYKVDSTKVRYHQLDRADEWKRKVLSDLIDVREELLEIEVFDSQEVQEFIDIICTQ